MRAGGGFFLPNIDALLNASGNINIGYLPLVGQVAIASDSNQTLAMLRRLPAESVTEMLLRLDAAVHAVNDNGTLIDEINA